MNEVKRKKLVEAYETFIGVMLMEVPRDNILDVIAPDIMGYGTTIDEKIFQPQGVIDIIQKQIDQGEGMDLSYTRTPVYESVSENEDVALIVEEFNISIGNEEMINNILVRLSFVLYYIEDDWKVIHWHGSSPVESEDDTWHLNQWKVENERLEKLVTERTTQLNQSIEELKNAQAQLIHAEKMASLGELTAGIAHEIQNPLNFVNNFSDVSVELIEEVQEELQNGEVEEAISILKDLKENLSKVTHHGQRASGIVRSMLDHSRTGSGEQVETDINEMCDEYLRLAYHGMRAKNQGFNAELITTFDESLPKIHIIPQDMGRVLLNLINNALQALSSYLPSKDLSKGGALAKEGEDYSPKLEVSTKSKDDKVIITISDNGPGIPDDIKDKIFQPFFTTKPTGQGTGLGLSLSYDIVKAHGGEIEIRKSDEWNTTIVVSIPIK